MTCSSTLETSPLLRNHSGIITAPLCDDSNTNGTNYCCAIIFLRRTRDCCRSNITKSFKIANNLLTPAGMKKKARSWQTLLLSLLLHVPGVSQQRWACAPIFDIIKLRFISSEAHAKHDMQLCYRTQT